MRRHRAPFSVLAALACTVAPAASSAQESATRHEWQLAAALDYVSVNSELPAWTRGGLGKLRFDADSDGARAVRGYAQYRGRLADTLWAHLVIDYAGDASQGLDVSEAYLTWRPVPSSRNQHQLRFGAFYPPLSLENSGPGWTSPYTLSYSAINTWLGEEIRPIGAEWFLRRHVGALGSPYQLGAFGGVFYGNDPAGTLLFWRGWSLHDRQSRLGDRLEIPPVPVWGASGIVGYMPQRLEPIRELDHRPGYYAGIEWRYGRRLLMQLARYDNRADPYAYSHREWGWDTHFDHLGAQLSLPRDIGLIAQWMRGDTYWLIGTNGNGSVSQSLDLVDDRFEAKFMLLTKTITRGHRLSVRYDRFSVQRNEAAPALRSDDGHAWTIAYRYAPDRGTLSIGAEWLQISSRRELWSAFYGMPEAASERALRVVLSLELDTRARH